MSAEAFYESLSRFSCHTPDRTLKALSFISGATPRMVLDIGAGDGLPAEMIRDATGASVHAVDVSTTSVVLCAARRIECQLVNLNHDPLPFGTGTFDVVHIGDVIEHVMDPDFLLTEARRVLGPKGSLVLTTPNLAYLPNRLLLALGIQPLFTEVSTKQVLGRRLKALGQGNEPVGHLRIATFSAMEDVLRLNGFAVEKAEGAHFMRGKIGRLEGLLCRGPKRSAVMVIIARPVCPPDEQR